MGTGTTTFANALTELGLKTYHGADTQLHLVTPLVDKMFSLPENGGHYIASKLNSAKLGCIWWQGHTYFRFFNWLTTETLAEQISKCRPDAITFDANNRMWDHIYESSPGAKVPLLKWRTFKSYEKSFRDFNFLDTSMVVLFSWIISPPHMMPYGVILIPFFNWISGGAVQRFKRQGLPIEFVMDDTNFIESVGIKFYQYQINERQIFHMRYTQGASIMPGNETSFKQYYDDMER